MGENEVSDKDTRVLGTTITQSSNNKSRNSDLNSKYPSKQCRENGRRINDDAHIILTTKIFKGQHRKLALLLVYTLNNYKTSSLSKYLKRS